MIFMQRTRKKIVRLFLFSTKNSMKIKNIGGHFPGSSILIVPFLSPGGTILCGDTFYISPSKTHVSVMYSYPNFIPVSLSEIKRINGSMNNIPFDTLLGAFDNQKISPNAKEILHASLEKYSWYTSRWRGTIR